MLTKGHFNAKLTFRRTVLIFLMTLIMLVIALIARQLFGLVLSSDRKVQAFILSLLVAAVGGGAYIYMALKIRLAENYWAHQ